MQPTCIGLLVRRKEMLARNGQAQEIVIKKIVDEKHRYRSLLISFVVAILLLLLSVDSLVTSYQDIKDYEITLEKQKKKEKKVDAEIQENKELISKLKDDGYMAKYIRAKQQYSKDNEKVYNIPHVFQDSN